MTARLLLFAGVLALVLLAAEGALSLLAGRSLAELAGSRRAAPPASAPAPRPVVVQERAADSEGEAGVADDGEAAPGGAAGGMYQLHPDPRVGYVLKPDAQIRWGDARVATDGLGLRQRPGPPPPAEALRLIVLGDSVAFGIRMNDDQTLAARLEAWLAERRGPAEPPVACYTVAIPSWNHRAAAAFLVDHWDELRPDLVLYVPVMNDVCDIDLVDAGGGRLIHPDPASPDPWLCVSVSAQTLFLTRPLLEEQGGRLDRSDLGPNALYSDLCAESRRRHDENAATIAALHARLAQRGCGFAVVWTAACEYQYYIMSRLAGAAPGVGAITLLRAMPPQFTLGDDPHPSALTFDVWGRWLAETLTERGLLARGEGRPLPEAPAEYAGLRMERELGPEEYRRLADAVREKSRLVLRPDIDLQSQFGLDQVLGGLNPDLSVKSCVLAMLAPQGDELLVVLEPVTGCSALYPLPVAVEASGVRLGEVSVPAGGPVRQVFALPADLDRSRPLEVRLVPRDWTMVAASQAGRARMPASFRLVRLACQEAP